MTLFRRSNDVEVSVSPEFDKEYKPDERPLHTCSSFGHLRCHKMDLACVATRRGFTSYCIRYLAARLHDDLSS